MVSTTMKSAQIILLFCLVCIHYPYHILVNIDHVSWIEISALPLRYMERHPTTHVIEYPHHVLSPHFHFEV